LGSVLSYSVFRKPTNSNAFIHFFSFHDLNVKISVIQGFFLRAYRVCSKEFLEEEIDFIYSVFKNLAYPKYLVDLSLKKAKKTFLGNVSKPKFDAKNKLIVPYLPSLVNKRGFMKKFNSDFIFTYKNKLCNVLISNGPKRDKTGVYQIPCNTCDRFYIGETGRELNTRLKEHQRDFINRKPESAIFNHYADTGHKMNFNDANVIYVCNNLVKRRIVESSVINEFGVKSINQNKGFFPQNNLYSNFILNSINFKFK
jgi:hypothetical protein